MKEWIAFLKNRNMRIVLVCIGALMLLLLVWQFFSEDKTGNDKDILTENELKITKLLCQLDYIDHAYVAIAEDEGVPVNAVVFFDGNDSILARVQILEITSSILKIDKKNIQIYPA